MTQLFFDKTFTFNVTEVGDDAKTFLLLTI